MLHITHLLAIQFPDLHFLRQLRNLHNPTIQEPNYLETAFSSSAAETGEQSAIARHKIILSI